MINMARLIMPTVNGRESGVYEFRKKVVIPKSESVTIRIFAATGYTLYINGKCICEGPCKSAENIRYFDVVESDCLKDGTNEIVVKVMHLTHKKRLSSFIKTNNPVLLFDAHGENVHITSDETWECFFAEGHKLISFDFVPFISPNEEIDAGSEFTPLELAESFDTDFEKFYDGVGIEDEMPFKPRPIPMIYPQEESELKIIKSGSNFIELDAGKYVTANVNVKVQANSEIKIIYSECYADNNKKERRDADGIGILDGPYDIVRTKNEAYEFRTFRYRAFRFIRIECENPRQMIGGVSYNITHYPLDICGSFGCSDKELNGIYDVSINTFLSCLHDTFVDCPYYEQQQYVMDSAIESSVLMCISEDLRPIKKCIEEFAVSQQSNGLILANYPCGYKQIIPGFSFFWIYMLYDYFNCTGDAGFVYKQISVMDKILCFFNSSVRDSGLIRKSEYWDYVDWVPGWYNGAPTKDDNDAITVYNMYYATALKYAAEICTKVGRNGLADEYNARYIELKAKIREFCFDKDKQMFKDGSESNRYSMHTVIWAIISGIADENEINKMLPKLNDKEIAKSSFSMNYYLFRALEKTDSYELMFGYLNDWRKMLELGCTTWCENPDNPRSECHAWSCAPVYEFMRNILGVKISFEDEILIAPKTGELKYAKGNVATRFGAVQVDWSIEDNIFHIAVTSTNDVRKRLILPNGEEKMFSDKYYEMSCKLKNNDV